jgi:histidine triad (HIT) family protein
MTIFTKIINRQLPAYIIAEDDAYIALLDIMPLAIGHTLIVPKKEIDYFFDLPDAELATINAFAKKIAAAIKKTYPCNRISISILGLEVPHAHMHLVPINTNTDLDFSRSRLKLSPKELVVICEKIKGNLS